MRNCRHQQQSSQDYSMEQKTDNKKNEKNKKQNKGFGKVGIGKMKGKKKQITLMRPSRHLLCYVLIYKCCIPI